MCNDVTSNSCGLMVLTSTLFSITSHYTVLMEVCRCAVGCVRSPGRRLTLNDLSSESETESEDEEVEYLNETNFLNFLSFCMLFLTRLKKNHVIFVMSKAVLDCWFLQVCLLY